MPLFSLVIDDSSSRETQPYNNIRSDKILPDDRLIVALDLPNIRKGLEMVETLGDSVNFYKIGLGMLFTGGPPLIEYLKDRDKRLFLDMKFFDIGATVECAIADTIRYNVSAITKYKPDFLTVHGDPYVVRAAVAGRGKRPMKILAVTFLTSLGRDDLDAALIKKGDVKTLVVERARLALEAGADGVIASPHEASAIRALPEANGKLIITPGVRPAGAKANDQKRIATPREAIANGANHIVIGRPILKAKDPREAVLKILEELRSKPSATFNGR